MAALDPVLVDPQPVNPSPQGLVAATAWTDEDAPLRWLAGMKVQTLNYGGDSGFGVWEPDFMAVSGDLTEDNVKVGERPEFPEKYVAMTSWGADNGMPSQWSQAEVQKRAQQNHKLQEPKAVEAALSTRLLSDGASPESVDDLVEAVSQLEADLADTGTLGMIHAGAQWAAYAAQAQLIRFGSGATLTTPLGHRWVFGAGYRTSLGATLVATSPTFGFRGPVVIRDAIRPEHNKYVAIAERSLVVGYEAFVGAATIT